MSLNCTNSESVTAIKAFLDETPRAAMYGNEFLCILEHPSSDFTSRRPLS